MKEMINPCCVCSDERGCAENPIVYCDGAGCNIGVHQACYGIVTVPTGPWYCRKCESQERPGKVRCELCPSKDGALKRTDNNGWAHVVCALYIPEVNFASVKTMEPIIITQIPSERFNKVCYICQQNGKPARATVGACMQCNKINCDLYFHVTCAQTSGLLCEEAGMYLDNVNYCGYCKEHNPKFSGQDKLMSANENTNITPDVSIQKNVSEPLLDPGSLEIGAQTSISTNPFTIRLEEYEKCVVSLNDIGTVNQTAVDKKRKESFTIDEIDLKKIKILTTDDDEKLETKPRIKLLDCTKNFEFLPKLTVDLKKLNQEMVDKAVKKEPIEKNSDHEKVTTENEDNRKKSELEGCSKVNETSKTKNIFEKGLSAPHMLGNQLNPASTMAKKMSDTLYAEIEDHSIFTTADDDDTIISPRTPLIGPPLYSQVLSNIAKMRQNSAATAAVKLAETPQTLEQLLERQWEQGSPFLTQNNQYFDIASLLSGLYQVGIENERLEEYAKNLRSHIEVMQNENIKMESLLANELSEYVVPKTNQVGPEAQKNYSSNDKVDESINQLQNQKQEISNNELIINKSEAYNSVIEFCNKTSTSFPHHFSPHNS